MKNLLSKKTANEIVIEIHNEIDSAQERLLQQAKDIISTHPSQSTIAERMAAIGFINTVSVANHLKNKRILVKNKEQAELIEYYKQTYPFQKFITEDEMNRICKKYHLIYKPVENYTKDIPERNLKEIEDSQKRFMCDDPNDILWCELKKDNSFFLVMGNGRNWCGIWGSEWWRIPTRIEGRHFSDEFDASSYLRRRMGFTAEYLIGRVKNFKQDRQGLFIAAPPSHFKGIDKSIFFVEPKDPIVFRFVRGGIQVLSKWGLEGKDESLINEKLN